MVPVLWTGLQGNEDFSCSPVPGKVVSLPGLCSGGVHEGMLCLENESPAVAVVERGDVLARGSRVPEGALYSRRGPHPETGVPAEVLVENEGKLIELSSPQEEVDRFALMVPEVSDYPEVDQGSGNVPRGAPLLESGAASVADSGSVSSKGSRRRRRRKAGASSTTFPLVTPLSEGEQAPETHTAGSLPDGREYISHLVQNDEEISKIINEELPPDEYYDKLRGILAKKFEGANPALVDHCVALAAAFDTAAAFAMSFGINKFQLAQLEVKLVGSWSAVKGVVRIRI